MEELYEAIERSENELLKKQVAMYKKRYEQYQAEYFNLQSNSFGNSMFCFLSGIFIGIILGIAICIIKITFGGMNVIVKL